MRQSYYQDQGANGSCRIGYTEWGDSANKDVVVCVHGLTRNARDFDILAKALSKTHRVVCVDVPGRGQSDWYSDPLDYSYPNYSAAMGRFLAAQNLNEVVWVGTSMGGIIGMTVAAMPGNPIKKMVINDVGPFLPKEALQRINMYLSMAFAFKSVKDIELHLRKVHEPFGPLTDSQWAHMAAHSSVQKEDGSWALSYDPAIKEPFKDLANEDIAFWEVWDAIKCPTLLIRGETSDILLRQTAEEMLTRGPECQLIEFPGIGHAPALMSEDQVSSIVKWINSHS